MIRLSSVAKVILPFVLVASAASPVLADTGGEGGGELGLDAITITSTSVNSRTGVATISGTVSCSQDLNEVSISIQLEQVVGRFNTIRGWGWTSLPCSADPGSAAWSIPVPAEQGKFAGGSATVRGYADTYACGEFGCLYDSLSFGPLSIRLGR